MSTFAANNHIGLNHPGSDEEAEGNSVKVIKNASDLQRLKVEKLMRQPEKPVYIPEKRKERKMPAPPEFMRNAWGSSAGAGSGDFHVYRGVRRREYARQKFLTEKSEKDEKDSEYQVKLEQNQKAADERTSKKRAKRLKKKQKAKMRKETTHTSVQRAEMESSDDEVSEKETSDDLDVKPKPSDMYSSNGTNSHTNSATPSEESGNA